MVPKVYVIFSGDVPQGGELTEFAHPLVAAYEREYMPVQVDVVWGGENPDPGDVSVTLGLSLFGAEDSPYEELTPLVVPPPGQGTTISKLFLVQTRGANFMRLVKIANAGGTAATVTVTASR